jgi:hypothetical protein
MIKKHRFWTQTTSALNKTFLLTCLFAIGSGCAKKDDDDSSGSPWGGNTNRGSLRYSGETFGDQVTRFDNQVTNGPILFTEEIVNLRNVTATAYARTDIARMQKGQTARIQLPNEVVCLSGSFSVSHPARPAGGVYENLFPEASNQNCLVRVRLDNNPTAVSTEYGRIVFTGTVRHQNIQKSATYTVIIKDSNDLGGRTDGSTTPGSSSPTTPGSTGTGQNFINVGDSLNLGDSAGQIEVFQYQGQDGSPLNALVFPVNTINALLELTVNMPLPTSDSLGSWRYKAQLPTARNCWIVHTTSLNSNLSSDITVYNNMPLPDAPLPVEHAEGDPLCPITIPEATINNANATARIKLETEPLPGFDARYTVKYLGRYGSFLEGPRNFVGYELRHVIEKVSATNPQVILETRDQINTFTFNINVRQMSAPTALAAHEFIGSHNGKAYFLIKARMTQVKAEQQAGLLKSYYNLLDAHLVHVDDAA